MLETQCPDRSLLVAFQLGKLSPDLLEQVASHVETCPSCQEQLDHLSDQDDPLLAELRKISLAPTDLAPPSTEDGPHFPQVTGHRVLEELGKGGMGVVYRAWNVALNRPVAIKTVQAAYRGNQSAIERFRAEAQITSQLQHPGIPPVHEMGTLPDGRPYLTMKLVKGRTLAELLQQRPDPNTDRGRYLAIFEQVCHAVGYAHSHQVIHRDLKPANVMVGAHGEVQVMDWGLAKLLTQPTGPRETQPDLSQTVPLQTEIETPARDSSETRTGSVIGTPAYMPPEQAAGEVHRLGPRSDVFALGAILCQILTGRPPYRGSDANAVKIKAVRGELAEALAALEACGAEPELVALCKRCLAFAPEDRPEDGNAVAHEVAGIRQAAEERARRAELARAEALVREAEQRRRRRVWRALVGVLLVGLVLSTFLYLRAYRAEQEALAERDEKEAARARAVTAQQQAVAAQGRAEQAAQEQRLARELAERRLGQLQRSNEILAGIFEDLDIRAVREQGVPLEAVLARRLVAAAGRLQGESVGDPAMVAELQDTLGICLIQLGFAREAAALLEQALETNRTTMGPEHPDTLRSMNNLASAYRDAGQLDKALPLYQQTLELRKVKLGAEHPDTLTSMNNLANAYYAAGQLDKALPLYEQTLELMKAKLGAEHRDTLSSMNNLANAYSAAGQLDKAIALQEQTLELRKAKLGAEHPDTLRSMNNLANAYRDAGQLDKAIALQEQTLELMKAKLGPEHPDTLSSMNNLAYAYRAAGQLDKAIALQEQTLELMKAKLGAEHPDTLTSMNNLASAYRDAGQLDKALPLYEQTLELRKVKLGAEHPDTLRSMNNLANAYRDAGQLDKAIALQEQTLELMKAKLGAEHPDTLSSMNNLANAYSDAGQLDKALPLLEEAARAMEKRRFQSGYARVIIRNIIGGYVQAKQFHRAERWRPALVAVAVGADSPAYLRELDTAAQSLLEQKHYPEAEALLRESLTIRQKQEPNDWKTFDTMSLLGQVLAGQKQYADAERLLLAGHEGLTRQQDAIPAQERASRLEQAARRLVELYTAWGKPDQARKWQPEAADQQP